MAETSMNFGPEWIRTLTERGSGGKVPGKSTSSISMSSMSNLSNLSLSSGPRYNKEEMLDRVRSMLSMRPSAAAAAADEQLMFPPEYLEKDYCRIDPALWLKRDEEEMELRASGLPANSEASLRFYKKEGLLGNLSAEEGGGALGDPPFERHRSLDASSSKGPRSYERSMSDRGGGGGGGGGRPQKWYDRSNTEEKFNGTTTTSPRKTYTRVPFDDWRKTPSTNNSKDDEWRTVKQTNNRLSVWRSPLDNEAGFRKFEFSKSNTTNTSSRNPKWREDSSSSYKMSSSRGGGSSSYSSRGGVHASNFRRRQESTDTLPEWAHDDVPLEKIGGSFDSAGKFQQPFKAMGDENHENATERGKDKELLDNVEEGQDREVVEKGNNTAQENQHASNGNENHVNHEKNEPDKEITPPSESERITPNEREKGPTPPSEERPLEEVGGSILSQLEGEEKKKVPSGGATIPNPPSPARMNKPPMRMAESVEEYKWIYLDPEGKTQGSFPSIQMLDWFQKGYFPPDLRLRRTIDKRFMQLSEFTKLCGYIPFLPGVQFPPLEAEDEVQKLQQQIIEREQATYMRQLQAQLIMQQLVQQQEQQHQQQQQQQQQQQFISSLQQPPPRPDPPLLNKLMQMLGTNPGPVTNSNMNLLGGGVERPPLLNGPDQIPIHPTDPIKQLLAQQSIRPPFSDVQSLNIQKPPPQPAVPSPQNYDPIKSLLAQLQLSVQPPPNATPVPPATNRGNGGAGGNYFNPNKPNGDPLSHRILSDAQQPPPQQQQQQQVQPVPTSINQSSIWDVEGNIPYKGAEPPISSVSQIWNKSNPHLAPQAMLNPADERNFQIQQQNLERLKQEELQKQGELLKKKELEKQEELLRQQEELEKKKEELRLQQEQFEKQQQELLRQKELQQLNNGQFSNSSNNNYRQLNEEPDNPPTPSNAHLETKELKLPGDHESNNNMNSNDFNEDVNFDDFVKPEFTEKKDRKNRKAEEKRKSREAKKENSMMNHQKYIPGMEGSQKPAEPIVAGSQNNNHDDYHYEQETQEQALTRLREEQQAALIEKEKQLVPQQVPVIQPKLAPWAKKAEEVSNNELSLAEIQKIEAEREREARIQKENREAQMRELMRVEEEPLITPKTNWQQSTQAEDFMQIVEEEYRLEKARQEKEKKNKKNRQKDLGLAQASVWGSGSSNLSWASKTSSNISVPQQQQQQAQNVRTAPIKTVVAPPAVGFWEDSPSISSSQKPKNEAQQQQQSASPAQNKPKKSAKKGNSTKDESKQGGQSTDSDKSKQRNAFEDWCTNALKSYSVQVDIPIFLSFLESIECPFEVNDYISSYIGEGKGPKSFAKEYLERRSKWKNSLKTANKMEDNLMAPATAINPGEISEFQSVKGNKSKNKRSKGGKAQKMDMSHLLGFSVASNRVNAGELDLPQ